MTVALGVDVGATKISAGVVDLESGAIRARLLVPAEVARGGVAVLHSCVELARRLAADAEPVAVGIGVCETVDLDGRVTSAHSFDWRGLDVTAAFAGLRAAHVESDVRAAALAESVWGAGRGRASFLYVNVGSGISSTLMLEGAPCRGARGNAILIGAGPLDAEAAASGVALKAGYGASAEELDRAAESGDPAAAAALETAGGLLGDAIAFAVNLLDPEIVVLGGGLGHGSRRYGSAAEAAMRAHIWADNTRDIPFIRSVLGADAGLVGAALVAASTSGTGTTRTRLPSFGERS